MFLIFSIRDKFDRGRKLKNFVFKTIVITVFCSLCLSWQYSPWTPILSPTSSSPPPAPSIICLHHEQTIAVVTYSSDNQVSQCKLILAENNDRFDKIQLLHHFSTKMPVRNISFDGMIDTIQSCEKIQTVPETPTYQNPPKDNLQAVSYSSLTKGILPGTLWCGSNDIAGDYKNLGPNWRLDKCCRSHDHCPVKVKPFQRRYGLFNLGVYTKSHCVCDDLFYNCLKTVNETQANAVGDFYFNIIGVQCLQPKLNRNNAYVVINTKRKF